MYNIRIKNNANRLLYVHITPEMLRVWLEAEVNMHKLRCLVVEVDKHVPSRVSFVSCIPVCTCDRFVVV